MGRKITLEEAKKNINSKFDHLTVLKFNGSRGIALFNDKDYGIFEGIYNTVLTGGKQHPERVANNRFKISFDDAKKRISSKFDYLILLKFNGTNKKAKFLDKDFGEFEGIFYVIEDGRKNHPERSKINKQLKRRKTCLKKYGVEHNSQLDSVKKNRKENFIKKYGVSHPCKLKEIKEKIKQTNLERYGVECILQSDYIKHIMINKNLIYNIDGYTATDYYKIKNIKGSLTSFHRNIREININYAINFNPLQTNIENIISIILNKHKLNFKHNKCLTKTKIKPDFLIKDRNLIIECDGLYYHSDQPYNRKEIIENKNWHKKRQEKYKELGYNSLFFREDEILNKTSIVESIILAKLNLISNKIYARKCKIKKIDSKIAKQFFEDNHLMGKGTGKCFALIYNDEIVSAIRVVNKKNYLDISRFCNKINTSVAGGLSKLLKHVIKKYNPSKIASFVDMRYGDGSSLKKLGFQEKTNYVSFKWTDFKNTYHRMNFPKNSGYEKGLYKVWDCGQKKFETLL